jgi:hypothetical protein
MDRGTERRSVNEDGRRKKRKKNRELETRCKHESDKAQPRKSGITINKSICSARFFLFEGTNRLPLIGTKYWNLPGRIKTNKCSRHQRRKELPRTKNASEPSEESQEQ